MILINFRTTKYWTVPICNLSCKTKLMQKHYKFSKIEKNGMHGIIFFSAKFFFYLSTFSPGYLFAIRGRRQGWEKGIRKTLKVPVSQLFSRIFGLRKNPEYLYRLFDVFPKQTTFEMETPSSTSLHSTIISWWVGS